jgi:hypothetical protein
MPLARYAAVVTLFVVPAVVVNFLTGNTTLPVFADPISLVILFGSYGSGAVLATELTLRWQKGFASTLFDSNCAAVSSPPPVVTDRTTPEPHLGQPASSSS